MKLILQKTIESLGIIGSEVEVADGYARNYLLPQGKAILSSAANRRLMDQQRQKSALRADRMAASLPTEDRRS